ncbi:hypothetical protein A2Y85_04385 [candidate division WOR-3 bacterium RBG_13_43_14]|uniref:Bacterial sugar transferase domain-containing protein n=1 Tax=candidate division WOR-3 bacterium RBG_13_43_14 TaxID=1802590 RepID=A0A1F4UC47_UNCW3|nr:MAG: hypothetical protein A2Y85_04385 [candidate division WOR-3 bacterium RBG_13_43_14]
MTIDISIVIVNYNVRAFLEQCLLSIHKAKHDLNIEVFVVDNASVDGSQAMVRKKFPDVILVDNKENVGFSRANNQALRQAKGQYILILNPDTLLQEDTVLILNNFMDTHNQAGAVGCKLLNPDGSFQITSRRSLPIPWVAFTRIVGLSRIFPKSRLFGQYNMTYLDPEKECEVEVLPGSLIFARRQVLESINYFDEDYFMYGEDVDLCYRISKAGWKIYYTPSTKAIHYKGESTKKGEFSFVSNFYTAMLIFTNKHFRDKYSFLLRSLLRLGIYGRALFAYSWRMLKYLITPLLDFILILGALLLAVRIWLPQYSLVRFRFIMPFYAFIWITSLYLSGVYHKPDRYRVKPVMLGAIIGLLIAATFTYFFKQFAYSRVVVMISFALIIIQLSLWRILYRLIFAASRPGPLSRMRRAIIVGAGREGKRILKKLQRRPDMHYEICGFIDVDTEVIGTEVEGTEVLATIDNIRDVIRVENIDDVIFSTDRLSNAQILETIIRAQGSGVNFRIVPHELEYIVAKSSVDAIDDVPLLDIAGIADPLDLMVKRTFDIMAALLISLITLPFFIVNLICGGRLAQRQIVGSNGQPVIIDQFKGGLPLFKWIPIYYHVLIGHLSIVGSEMVDYEATQSHPIYKPGLTGLVQIKRREKKGMLTVKERDYYNLYYVKNQTLITDLQIIIKSIIR